MNYSGGECQSSVRDLIGGRYALPLLLLFAFLIRFWLITWGIGIYWFDKKGFHPDEPKIVKYVHTFPDSIKDNWDLRYPTGLHHLLNIPYSIYRLTIRLVGLESFLNSFLTPIQQCYLLCRLFGIVAGTLCVWSVYRSLILLTASPVSAFIGSFSLNFFVLHTLNSAVATTDVPLSLASILTYGHFLSNRGREAFGTARFYTVMGVLLGLAIAIKYTGLFLIPPLFLFCFWEQGVKKKEWTGWLGGMVLASLVAVVVFVVLVPEISARFDAVVQGLRYERGRIQQNLSSPVTLWRLKRYFEDGWGIPAMALLALSLLPAGWGKRGGFVEVGLFLVSFFALSWGGFTPRYLIAISPFAAILVGLAADFLLRHNTIPVRIGRYALYACFLSCLVFLVACLYGRFSWDTRIRTSRYIVANYPTGTTVGIGQIGDYRPDCWVLPGIDGKGYPTVDGLQEPKVLVLCARYADRARRVLRDPKAVEDRTLWRSIQPPSQPILDFYQRIFSGQSKYRLVTRIEPRRVPIEFAGDVFEVYERED